MLEKMHVQILLNTTADAELIKLYEPDTVIIATGSRPFIPPIQGADQDFVVAAHDVLLGKTEPGNRVVVIGGGLVGAETADMLGQQCEQVTIIEMLPQIMKDGEAAPTKYMKERFFQNGVQIHTSTKLLEIGDHTVTAEKEGERFVLENIDTVIIAVGVKTDRTLLDSMEIWEDVGVRYLNSIGIEAEPDLGTVLFTMSIQEGAAYVKEHYHLSQEPEEIEQGVLDIISNYYKKTALLKSGAKELLEKLDKHNIPMTVASSNNKKEIERAFERLGIAKYFDRIFTCEEVGAGKTKPDIYLRAAEYLGTRPEETVVFEDVIHAIRTAKQAGFQVVGIYDETSKDDQEEVRREADWYCREWGELMKKKTALTIAGSDSSGGAGIQADIKTMQANGVYAMSAITALTAQNTTGVTGIMEVSSEFLEQQLDAVITDIRPDAVKIGMVSSEELIKMISKKLKEYHLENIVVDPVMVATSGSRLISETAIDTLKTQLLPMATVITPNIPEAEVLAEMEIRSEDDMVEAAKKIHEMYHCAVLCKGGHSLNDANDLLYQDGETTWFHGKRINNPNTHGTGCTLSSAIASNLAKGYSLEESIHRAKEYISGALEAMLDLGKGSGPMDHGFEMRGKFSI